MNNISARMVYDNAKQAVINAFGNISESMRITQSFLRLEQILVAGKTMYNFPVLVNQGSPLNTEQRLNLQDTFIISQIGIYLGLPTSATDATYQLLSWLNPNIFTNAGAMNVIYNGSLSLLVDNTQFLPAWDLAKHQVIPQTQETGAANPPVDQFDGAEYGLYPTEPNILLVGSKNNVLNVNLPAGIATVDTNSRLIIKFNGLLVQNSTTVR